MTVTYMHHVHTAGKVGAFLRLLFLWKGSIYQGIWADLLLFLSLEGFGLPYHVVKGGLLLLRPT